MYNDPILQAIIDLLDKYGPKKLKGRWHSGDSMCIPKNILPCGFVCYDNEMVRDIANGTLRNTMTIQITVAVDMTRERSVPAARADSHEQVVEFVAGKDKNTWQLKPDSVLGALRANQSLYETKNFWIEVGTESTVNYGIGMEKRGAGIITAEGVITIQATYDQVAPHNP